MSASWSPRSGLRIVSCGSAGPEDIEGLGSVSFAHGAEDAYRALLGDDWQAELERRGFDRTHPERAWGVRSRRWCAVPGKGGVSRTEELAAAAARAAVGEGDPPNLLLIATSTPRQVSASTAARVADALGWECAAMDVRAGGTGALAAWALAAQALGPGCERALVVGAECMSAYLDPTDLSACMLYGDGASAVLIEFAPGHVGGLRLAHMEHVSASGTPFTVSADLPPHGGEGSWSFDQPDEDYRACLDRARGANVQALRQELDAPPDTYLPYAVTSAQVAEDAEHLGVNGDTVVTTLSTRGCVGAAGCLDAMNEIDLRPGRTLALTAAGGGIATARLVWTT